MAFRLGPYLERIGLGDVPGGAAGLGAVQGAHMRAIAFENIDPLLGIVPSLAPGDIVAKLVTGRRGGYCFEHNALFGAALGALGYTPQAVLGRVHAPSGEAGARTHQAFLVEAEGETWLCDTGFGGHGALAPVRLEPDVPQSLPNGTYRTSADAAAGTTTLERQAGGTWVPLYAIERMPVRPIDFEAANYLCARWDRAPFPANLMVAFHGTGGRVALFNRALTLGAPPDATRTTLASRAALEEVLCGACGLDLDAGTLRRIWAKIEDAPLHR